MHAVSCTQTAEFTKCTMKSTGGLVSDKDTVATIRADPGETRIGITQYEENDLWPCSVATK